MSFHRIETVAGPLEVYDGVLAVVLLPPGQWFGWCTVNGRRVMMTTDLAAFRLAIEDAGKDWVPPVDRATVKPWGTA